MKEEKLGIVYFLVLVSVLVAIWLFLIVNAVIIQQEAAVVLSQSVPAQAFVHLT